TEGAAGVNLQVTLNLTANGVAGTGTLATTVTADLPGNADYSTTAAMFSAGAVDGATDDIVVTAIDDNIVESATESFLGVVLTVTAGPATATGAEQIDVIDNDTSVITVNSVVGTENAGPLTFTMTLSKLVDVGVTVEVSTMDATATVADNDYTPLTNFLVTIPAGSFSATFIVDLTPDATIEPDETFVVVLGTVSASGRDVTTSATSGVGTIADDDGPKEINVDVSAASVVEDGATSLVYTFTRTGSLALPLVVSFGVGGNATFGTDYVQTGATTFSGADGTVTFAAGSNTATITIDPSADTTVELDESVTLTIIANAPYTLGAMVSASATITNDDSATVSIDSVSGNENAGSLTFTVTLSNPVDAVVTVQVSTSNGTATLVDNDYSQVDHQLITFNAGETSKTFTVSLTADNKVEQNETFTVGLSDLTNNGRDVTLGSGGTGTITNDDSATVSIDSVPGNEDAGPLTFTVTLSNPVDAVVTVQVSTSNGTATLADNDYSQVDHQLITFNAGETSKTFTVNLTADSKVEANETFSVLLSDLSAGGRNVVLGGGAGGVITNDDTSTLTITSPTVTEGTGGSTIMTFIVTSSAAVQSGFTVAFSSANGSATAGDYTVTTSSPLTFTGTAGETQSISVAITTDSIGEDNETFTVTLGTVASTSTEQALSITAVAVGTGTITNDDGIPSSRFFRIYQQNADIHFFTNSLFEFNVVVAQGNTNEATGKEGFGVVTTQLGGTAPLHRIYIPVTGAHYYTTNDTERNFLRDIGNVVEPDMGFVYSTQVVGTTEVFRLYNIPRGVHLFTDSVFEKDSILAAYPGVWRLESSLGFAVHQGVGTFTTGGATQAAARRAAAREAAEHLDNANRTTSGAFNQLESSLNTVSVDSSATVASLLSVQQPTLTTAPAASQPGSLHQESRLPSLSNSVTGDLRDSDLDDFWGEVGVGEQSDSFWHLFN
ncbi:MAG: hypothetical protein HZA46_14045, partial [Planctomycetales bacterium]|nr:hypothetical protein [Planctomycetales bacterium]